MRKVLIELALALVALPAWAQVPDKEWDRCAGARTGAGIPDDAARRDV